MKKLVFLSLVFLSLLTFVVLCLLRAKPEGSRSVKSVKVDGSSTVFPITEAVAEEFQKINPSIRVTVGISGTGGGFKRFTVGETDINDASRPIKETEREAALKNGIQFIELPVAYDGLSVVVSKKNSFVTSLTLEDLKKIWQPGSAVKKWSDVRKGWPDRAINLYGPGTDSGTFDYFTEAVVGKEKASRADFTASEDDNVLVQGVAGDQDALGYFGYAYYLENKEQLHLVSIDAGKGAIAPSDKTIANGEYPLSRPLLIYVSVQSASRPEIQRFTEFYLKQAKNLVKQVGYLPLSDKIYGLALKRFEQRKAGSLFTGTVVKKGMTLETLLKNDRP
jgi:phosphate transport system substrate-binding protein